MDIQEAKEQIRQTVQIYLQKDARGHYQIPVEKQRPVFLLGAPGIGKTAIMEQIAQEMQLPLVAYSMSHHTRQSALGLPMIVEKEYQGEHFSVSEYTLSEIISTLYDCMERTGSREGILFLDEINCVSETLAPSMLQFLQYKTFGNHPIPRGWVIVTAGNPPRYNRAVREFDIVTMDRLKVLEIEPDFAAWQRYAKETGVHRAIQTFLDIRRDHFYRIEDSREGRRYVTARGWEDLSEAICLYEENGFTVDTSLITQYIRHEQAADEFATYYALYCKHRGDYPIREILDGTAPDMQERAVQASLDERITLLELLLETLLPRVRAFETEEQVLKKLQQILRKVRDAGSPEIALTASLDELKQEQKKRISAGTLSRRDRETLDDTLDFLQDAQKTLALSGTPAENSFAVLREAYEDRVRLHQTEQSGIAAWLTQLFTFTETCWGTGNEMLILVTELTADPNCMAYMYSYDCPEYARFSDRVRLAERHQELSREISDYFTDRDIRKEEPEA